MMTEREAAQRLKASLESMAYGTGTEFDFSERPIAGSTQVRHILIVTENGRGTILLVSGCVRRVAKEESTVEEEAELINSAYAERLRRNKRGI